MPVWTTIGAWLLVAAVAFAAHLFGREARPLPASIDEATPRAVRRSRIGVAVSITGPLVVFLAGVVAAVTTRQWSVVGLITVIAIAAISAIGLFLAPH